MWCPPLCRVGDVSLGGHVNVTLEVNVSRCTEGSVTNKNSSIRDVVRDCTYTTLHTGVVWY